ncbi:hypothetical protein [Streptomyces boncukensis]|uniref:Uncharacterized protein n=1 Tax=Streptomyces boncukensis TaxID=2711219 RepID=A0A6G4X8J9_9ACTN|nr:hypothetical protein [Streptomyces boncukensis]NGO73180.1 hypothetical protein [Streptomyces boncukensis]
MNDIALPTAEQARALTDRIRIAVDGTWQLITEAYTTRAWAALGYDSWDAYCTAEFGQTRLKLPREERQEAVVSLRDSGLSTRAIAVATGADQKTVRNDLAGSREEYSSPVTGTDGKTYAASRPAPQAPSNADLTSGTGGAEPEELDAPLEISSVRAPHVRGADEPIRSPVREQLGAAAKRRPLPEAFADAARDLTRAAERLARLAADDRFPRHRDQTHHQAPELLSTLDHLTRLVTAMRLHDSEAGEEARRWWATSLHTISDALSDAAHSIQKEH